jgi:hypothetical protein
VNFGLFRDVLLGHQGIILNIRDTISRQKRKTMIVAYAGFILFGISGFTGFALTVFDAHAIIAKEVLFGFGLLGFITFFSSILLFLFGIRCPSCSGRIGRIVSYSGTPFTVSQEILVCPQCGVSFDSQYEEPHNA